MKRAIPCQATVILCLFVCFLADREARAVTFPLGWSWANPAPHGNNIIDVASTGQFWVQVCERGQYYTSTNGTLWIPGNSPTTNALRAVTFYHNAIVATGERGTVLSGQNPANLTFSNLGTGDWLEGVAASPALAVAVATTQPSTPVQMR